MVAPRRARTRWYAGVDLPGREGGFVYKRSGRVGRFEYVLVYDKPERARLGPHYLLVRQPIGKPDGPIEGYAIHTFRQRHGRPALVQVSVVAKKGAELTSRAIRTAATLKEPDRVVRAALAHALDVGVPPAMVGFKAGTGGRPRRVGRTGYEIGFYLEIAARYDVLDREGNHHPIKTISGERGWTQRYTGDKVSQARKLGLLNPPARAGRSGGRLTKKALALLNQPS